MARRLVLVSLLLLPAGGVGAQAPQPAPPEAVVKLAPHRVVYDLSLVQSRGLRGIEGAKGRIVYEFSGNACEGYSLKFRQVTQIQGQDGDPKISDLRTANFESGDGKSFRFRNDNASEGTPKTSTDGTAEKKPGELTIRLKTPRRSPFSVSGDIFFPNAQMKEIIAAARGGKKLVQTRVYDGSDTGQKVYDTLAVIGNKIEAGSDGLEEAARQPWLASLPRWPVTVSYFDQSKPDGIPVYVLSFDLYENGVSRALKLDYGDFVLKGEMTRLEALPAGTPCQR